LGSDLLKLHGLYNIRIINNIGTTFAEDRGKSARTVATAGKKILIVGGVAVGPKVASRVRRLDPNAEIIIVEKNVLFSYAGCGLPYYLSGQVIDFRESAPETWPRGLISLSRRYQREWM
jgi:NADPH-dependent 2,4-dienoyl-CoA reductase/sulfur reductase-like enzyme